MWLDNEQNMTLAIKFMNAVYYIKEWDYTICGCAWVDELGYSQ